MRRQATVNRTTKETDIKVTLDLDGQGRYDINTPIGFLNHMMESFSKHGKFDLHLEAKGDLEVDQHHLVEDCGIVLGDGFSQALGDKKGINRAGFFVYPMDEALAVVAVDFGGRPYLQYESTFTRQFCGDLDLDLLEDFFRALAVHAKANIVVRMPFGRSDHHKSEAIFKALGKAFAMACSTDSKDVIDVPSTKGVI
jgi:imidazoleglycerol-phosphate dehydratase